MLGFIHLCAVGLPYIAMARAVARGRYLRADAEAAVSTHMSYVGVANLVAGGVVMVAASA